MKKIISIALCFVMLLNLTGVTINIGYCPMKHKTTYSLTKVGCCCKKAKNTDDKKDTDDNCCKNKKVTICKALDNYKASTVLKIDKHQAFADVIITPVVFQNQILPVGNTHQITLIIKPPGRTVKRNILYRQFLI